MWFTSTRLITQLLIHMPNCLTCFECGTCVTVHSWTVPLSRWAAQTAGRVLSLFQLRFKSYRTWNQSACCTTFSVAEGRGFSCNGVLFIYLVLLARDNIHGTLGHHMTSLLFLPFTRHDSDNSWLANGAFLINSLSYHFITRSNLACICS